MAACQPTSTGRRTCSSTRGCGVRASHQSSLQRTTICASGGHRCGTLDCRAHKEVTAPLMRTAFTYCSPAAGCLSGVEYAQRILTCRTACRLQGERPHDYFCHGSTRRRGASAGGCGCCCGTSPARGSSTSTTRMSRRWASQPCWALRWCCRRRCTARPSSTSSA